MNIHSPHEPGGAASVRILLAEDNPVNRDLIVAMLELFNCTVETSGNGLEALAAWSRQACDLILMDGQMPKMDGFEATRRIREIERAAAAGATPERHTVIIALTGQALQEDREQFLAAGMDDYLAKPFTLPEFQSLLEHWLPALSLAQESSTATMPKEEAASSSAAEAPAAGSAPLIDLQYLDNIRSLQQPGNPDLLGLVIDQYLLDAPRLLDNMRQGVAAGDGLIIQQSSHSLKSSSANLGARSLAELCRQLEMLSRDNVTEIVPVLVQEIEKTYQSVLEALSAIRQEKTL